MNKIESTSLNLEQHNIEEVKKLFPNAVTEGKIDFEKLKLLLGENLEERNEKYQFTWNGKSKAIKLAQAPSTSTLRPVKEDSVNWDSTENIYIEGDNLEVLKQLQKTYFGKIKMIYIDPPSIQVMILSIKMILKFHLKTIKNKQIKVSHQMQKQVVDITLIG